MGRAQHEFADNMQLFNHGSLRWIKTNEMSLTEKG